MRPVTSRRLIFVLLAILTLLAGYIAIILLVIAAGAPLSDGPRNRVIGMGVAILASAAAVTLGFATWRRWRASSREARRAPG
jgi:hypothetical protein